MKIIKIVNVDLVNDNSPKNYLSEKITEYGNFTNKEIAENNLTLSKEINDIEFVCSSIIAWLRACPDKNLCDLEKRFRFLNNGIYLIPSIDDDPDNNIIYSLPNFDKKVKFSLNITFSDNYDIKKEYHNRGTDLVNIYHNLTNTGISFPKDSNPKEILDNINKPLGNIKVKHKVMFNFTKFEKIFISPASEMEEHFNNAYKTHNQTPYNKVLKQINEQETIYGYVCKIKNKNNEENKVNNKNEVNKENKINEVNKENEENKENEVLISYLGHYVKNIEQDGKMVPNYQFVDVRDESSWVWNDEQESK